MKRKRIWLLPVLIVIALLAAFLLYTLSYYRAEPSALAALASDDRVTVDQTGFGWAFDGPGRDAALIFYPGGKVEETAYAPLLRQTALEGMDVFLVKMPFRLAVFGADRAADVMALYDYDRWYVGGHSLGGAMAAVFAAEHGEELAGAVLLAAYPTRPLDDGLVLLSVRGSEDGVLDLSRVAEGARYSPRDCREYVIEGGNHAGFGNYGAQRGDGEAALSPEEQQRQTALFISSLP
jgi:pimeloyl-ACP methyl ester carboxylesterase